MEAINIQEKFGLFNDQWSPKIITELNGQMVYLAKIQGEFVWHSHADEDECFIVQKGSLLMEFRDKVVEVTPGELIVVPKGVEHLPRTKDNEEVWIMLFEPKSTKHTGDVKSDRTVTEYGRI